MFKTIVWASDGSAAAQSALPLAKGIAESSGARLMVVYVDEIVVGSGASLAPHIDDEEGRAAVRQTVEALKQDGIAAEFVTGSVMVGGVARVISDFARDVDADLIVTGTRGRNPSSACWSAASQAACSRSHRVPFSPCPRSSHRARVPDRRTGHRRLVRLA